jgi:signal transduction histidine kinase
MSNDESQIQCPCGETLSVFLPFSYHKNNYTKPEEVNCPVCNRKYALKKYRNNTEIACTCGYLMILWQFKRKGKDFGRRKEDYENILLEKELKGMLNTARLIHSVRELDKLLILVMETINSILNAHASSVILRNEHTGDLVFYAVTGDKSPQLTNFQMAENEGIVGSCVQQKAPIIVNNVKDDPRFSGKADAVSGFTTQSILCLPLIIDDNCIGALEIVNKRKEKSFDQNDLTIGQAIVDQIALAVHNIQLTEAALKNERLAAIGQAVTGVAHCVKNMLNGLQGGLYILKKNVEKSTDESGDFGLEMLERNMDRLNDMVLDMLTYSKDREPEYKLTNINNVVSSVVDLMKVKAEERSLQLLHEPNKDAGEIQIDPKGIYRCVLNLVSNALDACDEENAVVKVNILNDNKGNIIIEVNDQGKGMDEATLKSIFQPFFSKKGSKGTGLGLSVTKKIVEEHGGSINVDSKPGKGSKFRIHLPGKQDSNKSL